MVLSKIPDKRNYKRYKYKIPINIYLSGVEDFCETVNISEGGVAFKTNQRYYRIGQYIKGQFIDTDITGNETFYQFNYKIVRIAHKDNYYVIGCMCVSNPRETSRFARTFEAKMFFTSKQNDR